MRATLILLTALLTAGVVHAEPMMVTAKMAYLYENRKPVSAVYRGTIVEASPSASDARALKVQWDGRVFDAVAKDFMTRRQVEDLLSDRVIDATTKLEAVNPDLKRQYEQLDTLHRAKITAERDQALVYREEVTRYIVQPGTSTAIKTRDVETRNVLSRSQYRRLERDLEKQIEELEASIDTLWKQRLELLTHLNTVTIDKADWMSRFAAPSGESSTWREHVVVAETATLWIDKRDSITVAQGTLMQAKPHPEAASWMKVEYQGKPYTVRGKDIKSFTDLRTETLNRLTELSAIEHRMEQEIQLLENRLGLYTELAPDLQRAVRMRDSIVIINGDQLHPGFGEVYVVRSPENNFSIGIDRSDAKRVLEDWDDEDLPPIQARLKELRDGLADIRKQAARAERDLRDLGIDLPQGD